MKRFLILSLILFLSESCSLDPSLFEDQSKKKINLSAPEKDLQKIIIKKDDTLYSISKRFNLSIETIMKLNNLDYESLLYIGQELLISKNSINNSKILSYKPTNFKVGKVFEEILLPVPKPLRYNLNTNKLSSSFIWPVIGKKLNKFGHDDDGRYNEGIYILSKEGTPVLSSANGNVIFVGNNFKGFGSIVLIKHDNGWISSYAHLSKIFVKENEYVKQGHIIGLIGKSGRVSSPQLYFEIREGKIAINPEVYIRS